MTAWIVFGLFVLVVGGCLALTAASGRAEQYLRETFQLAGVPFDDAELAEKVAREERAWAEWASLMRALDPTWHDEPTPEFDRAVRANITGGAA